MVDTVCLLIFSHTHESDDRDIVLTIIIECKLRQQPQPSDKGLWHCEDLLHLVGGNIIRQTIGAEQKKIAELYAFLRVADVKIRRCGEIAKHGENDVPVLVIQFFFLRDRAFLEQQLNK